jgi:predicted RNA-binding Zn-ribbon protein involved in translation (DUF1610 family)
MFETDELCWRVGQKIQLETGELYSKKHICPKCGDFERTNFNFKIEAKESR